MEHTRYSLFNNYVIFCSLTMSFEIQGTWRFGHVFMEKILGDEDLTAVINLFHFIEQSNEAVTYYICGGVWENQSALAIAKIWQAAKKNKNQALAKILGHLNFK